jgi:hypothetical protein
MNREQIEQYDPIRRADAPIGTRVRVNHRNLELWQKVSTGGYNGNGECIMRVIFTKFTHKGKGAVAAPATFGRTS